LASVAHYRLAPDGRANYPGATNTWTTSLNNLDVITGYYTKGATTQSFILVPGN
jgi:hypothetical protein